MSTPSLPLPFLHSTAPPTYPPPTLHPINTNFSPLPTDNTARYALTISSLFTPTECAQLLSAAESTTTPPAIWSPALVNIGSGRQAYYPSTRNCGRIIWDSPTVAAWLWARIHPYIAADILTLDDRASVTGFGPVRRRETWRATRLNERLRFLKYEPGQYFRAHCDGSYVTPEGREVSFVTVHLYLNGGEGDPAAAEGKGESLEGGETSFLSMDGEGRVDVNPMVGSVLVFQHRGLLHAGEEVKKGVKYTLRTDVMYEKVEVEGE